jgi:VWFA-related protein
MRTRIFFSIVALALQAVPGAQTTSAPTAQQPQFETYAAGATAVLVDVVVRDKRGQPLRGLTAPDFEIFEDGVRQRIGSFSVVERGGGIGITVGRRVRASPAAPAGSEGSPETPVVPAERPTVAIVFDALTPDALTLAQRAALRYLPMNGEPEARVGVFTADPGLRVLQPYTESITLVRRAVQSLTAAATTQQQVEGERRQALNRRLVALDALGVGRDTAVFSPDPGANMTAAQAIVEQQMTELEMSMLRSSESFDRDQRGFGISNALLSVIQSLAVVPGRKTLVYLSEGLPPSPAMQARLDGLVSAANRANVSVYAIDAAGLRAQSTPSETRREIEEAGQERLRQTAVSRDPTNGPMSRMVERTEDLLRLDPHGGLDRLAADTGGFLISDTNDLSSAFRRIDEDNRFHYLLTYSPSNTELDGKFRTIQVKVRHDGAQVFARKGYVAVRRPPAGFFRYEAAALAMLDRGKPPNDFPIAASGFVFPDPKGGAAVPLVVRMSTRELKFSVDEKRGTYTGQAVIVARIRDAAGRTIHTLSQQYLLSGAAKDVGTARDGEILFYRQPELQPGVYLLEALVQDLIAQRASARLSTLTVPAGSQTHVPASALVVVQRIEHSPSGERRPDLPFYYGDMLLYPNAGEPLRAGRDAELLFYFSFYKGTGNVPDMTLEILHSGQTLASMPIVLGQPVPDGRVQHVGKLPIEKFPPGTYELRLRLGLAPTEELRNTFFTIAK